MGMKIGMYNTVTTSVQLKNRDGSSAGTLTISRVVKSGRKKRLGYNFKRVSAHIMTAKTPLFAGKAVREARSSVVTLLMKKMSGDYDEREVDSALEHARKMERVAKKRRKHMEEEERAKQTGSCMVEEEVEVNGEEKTEEEKQAQENGQRLDEMARELERLMKESEQALKELAQELTDASWEDMDPRQLDNMKRRHRAEELREIMEADLKYLKALFDQLAREKQENVNGASSWSDSSLQSGVSLELGGVEMPVETSEAVAAEGAGVDVTV
ncbi:MAG: hypothetical protein NC341_05200 [Blautia sp.]|nr:hypothetical protein [Blautia sp.]MCM1199656.1 hypothetical protein [Bacteroides fragilis]